MQFGTLVLPGKAALAPMAGFTDAACRRLAASTRFRMAAELSPGAVSASSS